MISHEFYFTEEEDERNALVEMARKRKLLRDKSNPLEMDSNNFKKCFRLSKESFTDLLDEINSKLRVIKRLSSVPNILKLAATLRFFAEGGYQTGTGNDFNVGLAQPTFSLMLKEMLDILETYICPKWIKFNYSEAEKTKAKLYFFQRSGIPGVIGCVDGTHISIIKPKKELQHLYFNRKGFHSINTMIVCDHEMKIHYINSKYPGASHDSMVWNLSALKGIMHRLHDNGENSWLLGDAGYTSQPYLMTPCRSPASNIAESRYNQNHSKGRNIIERTIGVLKGRFRCLLHTRQLHYTPAKATQITNVCAALHNICIHYKVTLTEEPAPDEADDDESVNLNELEGTGTINAANTIRNRIIHLFI